MRVISGKYRGRRILPPLTNTVRPTTDKVKEAIFGILQTEIEDAVVIDLFAGTGALGIEALSRGAKKVYFCDGAASSIELIKQNTSFVEPNSYEILRGAFEDCLRRLSTRGVKANVVLCDPPYSKGIPEKALSEIETSGVLANGGIVVVERKTVDKQARKNFALINEKTYGEVSLDVYRDETKCAVTVTFDPFTYGHKFVVEKALEKFDFCHVVILVNENKQARYSVETRKRMIALSLSEYKNRIKIDYYDGMTVDYCKENGIQYIYRGYRNETDEKYEKEMAEYNFAHGGIETITVKAESEISSTQAKEAFDNNEDVSGFVCEDVARLMRRR